jgi:hypothetical protein
MQSTVQCGVYTDLDDPVHADSTAMAAVLDAAEWKQERQQRCCCAGTSAAAG